MGSEVRLTAQVADESRALRAFERVFDEFDRLDRLLSVWKAGSDVLRLNAEAGERPCRSARKRWRCCGPPGRSATGPAASST